MYAPKVHLRKGLEDAIIIIIINMHLVNALISEMRPQNTSTDETKSVKHTQAV